jgi:hypothetical protein
MPRHQRRPQVSTAYRARAMIAARIDHRRPSVDYFRTPGQTMDCQLATLPAVTPLKSMAARIKRALSAPTGSGAHHSDASIP